MGDYTIRSERVTADEYISFLKRTDLGSQYPRERFRERIERLTARVSISLTARDGERLVGVCFGITDFAYWLFITDLGVDREYTGRGIGSALLHRAHELAGGERDIVLYTCINENAAGFYEKLGFRRDPDVMKLDRVDWTDFTVTGDE